MEINIPFSGISQIILFEVFVQYLLDCLQTRGWEFRYLLNCSNATIIPLSLWKVAGCGVVSFLGQAPPVLAAKMVSDDW